MNGDEIRRWRATNRIKQEALASLLGVSHAAVSQWENGRARPSKTMALRLTDVMSGARQTRLAAEIAFTAPQQQIKALTRGRELQLVAISSGFRAAWPEMADFIGENMRPLLMNEAKSYVEDSDYLSEAIRGDLLMLSGVSNRLLSVGGAVENRVRVRWHTIVRQIEGELIHEIVFEPCAETTPIGFERLLRRSDIQAAYE